MNRFAVIGSNSFSGADFIDLLLKDSDNEALGISRSPEKHAIFLPYKRHGAERFQFRQFDLNRVMDAIIAALDEFEPECVVNFAAQSEVAPSWNHPEQWYQTNVVSLALLTNALRTRPYLRRFVQISSPEVYGTCVGDVREDAPVNPSTPYAASKAAADMHLSTLVKQFDFPLVTIRATNVYGASQQLWKIIPRTAIYLKLGRQIELHGGGTAVKSFIHIRDVSAGTLAAARNGEIGEIYHLSPDDSGHAVRDIVRRVCKLTGRDFDAATKSVDERPGQDAAYVINSNRARRELGWEPAVALDEGLKQVIDWVESNWPIIREQPLVYEHRA